MLWSFLLQEQGIWKLFDACLVPPADIGDHVSIRNVCLCENTTFLTNGRQHVHVVVNRAGTLPVYMLKPENHKGPLRTLHRDLLLPSGYLPTEDSHVQQTYSECVFWKRKISSGGEAFWWNIFSDTNWKKACVFPYKYCISNKIKEVHIKMLHTLYPTNLYFSKSLNNTSSFCNMEAEILMHLFYHCPHSIIFWTELEHHSVSMRKIASPLWKIYSFSMVNFIYTNEDSSKIHPTLEVPCKSLKSTQNPLH